MKVLRDLLAQLEHSQWQSAQTLQTLQMERFARLAQHAWQHSPFYRLRFEQAGLDVREPWTRERYTRIPLLTRSELMLQLEHLQCHALPPGHGQTYRTQTSGSTGQTVTVLRTDATQLFWLACSMRDHLWQQRDLSATLAVIKATTPVVDDPVLAARQGWGPPASLLGKTGPCYSQPLSMPVAQQARWLARIAPHTLLTYPTNLAALLDLHERGEAPLPATLREVRTVGETLHPGLRDRCAALGLAVVDLYSSQELGIIALQCPQSGLYHTQDENLIVEVLDEQGLPCAPGEVGRVVITDLHNYATPLIRYEIRDHAEAGPPCSCGRGLATLKRIMGRRRNMVMLPDGSRHWPLVGAHRFREIADIRQYQVVQHSLTDVEVRLVTPDVITPEQEARLTEMLHAAIGHPFPLRFSYSAQELPKTTGGKFEEFISLLP
ncbi:phenylacetate--CoA ligase family protein [Sideroxyarcus sp. TK5]